MGWFKDVKDFFITDMDELQARNEAPPTSAVETPQIVKDDDFLKYVSNLWQYSLALNVVSNLLGSILSDTKWETVNSNGDKVKDDVFYLLNFAPNKRQTASEFWKMFATKLVNDSEVLIVEMSDKQLYIADSYSFKNGEELSLKQNTFINVQIGNTILTNRSFKEGDSAILLKLPNRLSNTVAFANMQSDYKTLKEVVLQGAYKAMGTKYNLKVNSTKFGNKPIKEFIKDTTESYIDAMKQPNTVLVTFTGEELTDLTAQQRGSEVEQVLKVVDNNISINKEILANVARAFGIPQTFMTMDITTDDADAMQALMTTFAKPILKMVSQAFTIFYLDKENILSGAKVEADINSILYTNVLSQASAMDKLLSSGMYSINELREKVGDDTFDGGDTRYITKNYETLEDFKKGENDDES